MSDRWMPATASVAPASRARIATGTSSPAGANSIAASSGRRGSVGGPAGDTPSTIPNRAPSWCQREMVTLRAFVCAAWAKVS
jgi:hypothetical protein